jgi:hypothetical protein
MGTSGNEWYHVMVASYRKVYIWLMMELNITVYGTSESISLPHLKTRYDISV